MKTLSSHRVTRGASLAAIALAAAFGGQAALAATAANTTISNLATLNYNVGTVPQDKIESSSTGNKTSTGSPTTFLVDNKVNPVVTTQDTKAVSAIPNQLAVVTTFKVANAGNASQDFYLTIGNASGGAVFTETDDANFADLSKCKLQIGAGAAVAAPAFTNPIAAGADVTVQVLCDIPKDLADEKVVGVYLMAEARDPDPAKRGTALVESTGVDAANTVDTVFADDEALDDTTGTLLGKRNAKHSARSGYKIVTAILTVKKTVAAICDELNFNTNPKSIPGAYVQYTVEIKNDGKGVAQLTTMADDLDTYVTFAKDAVNTVTCKEGAGDSGFSVQSSRAGYPKSYTSTTSIDGADWTAVAGKGGKISIDFTKVLPASVPDGYATDGELKTGEFVRVIYNVKIN
jgi:hypothetical protein